MDFFVGYFGFTVFIIGLCIGSFINALVYRYHKKIPIARERSMCPKCKHQLGPLDLIPVLSFALLRGKCRYCKSKISFQYPLVELFSASLFLIVYISVINLRSEYLGKIGNDPIFSIMLIYLLIITSILIFITVYDLKYQIIPNKSIIIGIFVTLSYSIIQYLYFSQNQSIQHSVLENAIGIDFINIALGALVGSGLLFLVVLASRGKGMGMGDVKFAILMGLILGFPQILIALYIAIIVGAIFGITAIITKKAGMKTAIPFGPFLVLGTFITMLWGREILEFVNRLFF